MSNPRIKYKRRYTVGISMSKDFHLALKKFAESRDRSASSVVRSAVRRYMKLVGNPK